MSIVVPSGGDFNVILKRAPTRGTCSIPLQSSLTSQLLPGLPPPDEPEDLDIELDLDAPSSIDVSLPSFVAAPDCVVVVDLDADSFPAIPTGLCTADLDPLPSTPGGFIGCDIPEVATPADFRVQLVPDPEC